MFFLSCVCYAFVCVCLLAHLSRSDKVSFCDRSLSVVLPSMRPLTIDLNDNSSETPSPILK